MILKPTTFGIDSLLSQPSIYKKNRIALVCNDASVTNKGVATRVALLEREFKIVKLFSPEHGLSAAGVDGQYQTDGIDSHTGLSITSLYGDHFAPQEEDFKGVDLV
ncbi:MAG: exo-beta-N-acetylmuramidase NamZ domain-containing protein, partial [Ginsengibacter sp.]